MAFTIRPAEAKDADRLWDIWQQVIAGGDTYSYDEDATRDYAIDYWTGPGNHGFVAVDAQECVLGMCAVRANRTGRGGHVGNGSFMVSAEARGQGVARALGEHAIQVATDLGFKAIQFNFVVSTNIVAVKLWQSLGFKIIGTTPQGFQHKTLGLVDVHILHRFL